MPLRDHFRPPISKRRSWEGFHGIWPGAMCGTLVDQLPPQYVAEPRVHLGDYYEIDVSAYEEDAIESGPTESGPNLTTSAVAAAAPYTAPNPTLCIETEIPDQYEYEVLIFDVERERTLVAAIEIVSPANKDRPESRQLFVAKCANLMRRGVCVSIVDLVTVRRFNLYCEFLALVGSSDPAFASSPPAIYAATCRQIRAQRRGRIEIWSYPLTVGQKLPSLPIWLAEETVVSLDLETSYEAACRVLRIP